MKNDPFFLGCVQNISSMPNRGKLLLTNFLKMDHFPPLFLYVKQCKNVVFTKIAEFELGSSGV